MFQATQRRISEKIKSTLDSDALPFHEILDADMVESALTSEGRSIQDRILHSVCNPLPVPLSGARSGSLVSRGSHAVDPLDGT